MANVPTVAPPPLAAMSATVPAPASFDERWAAWQAKGGAHDRVVRRRTAVATPILLLVAAVIVYTFFVH